MSGILPVKLLLLILLHMAQNGNKIEQNTNPKDYLSMKIPKLLLEHLWNQYHQLTILLICLDL